jgi:hypothetical protein
VTATATSTPTPAGSATSTPTPAATVPSQPTPTTTPSKARLACARALAKSTDKFAGAYVQAFVACETARLKAKIAGPCPDANASARIAAAATKRAQTITKACGALLPSDVGFGASCGGFTGACTDAIASLGDVRTCLDCGARRAGDEVRGALYGSPADAAALKCQLAFGKSVSAFFRAATTALTACEDAVLRGKIIPPCPDAKTAARIAAKERKLRGALCKACGGHDKLCDGNADVAPTVLGLTACPDRSVPGGPACGAIPITGLADVVDCAVCVATFESRCVAAFPTHPTAVADECALVP